MVLDMRFLDPIEPAPEKNLPKTSAAPAAPVVSVDFEPLLEEAARAASPAARASALASLRQLVPSAAGSERLWQIACDPADGRRLVAVQMLGFHRDWLTSGSLSRRIAAWITNEGEAVVARAMVWCLRTHESVAAFLLHDDDGLALEAALGLPLGRRTLGTVAEALRLGRALEVERVLCDRLEGVHANLVAPLVEHLLEGEWDGDEERLEAVVARLPQVPLFECCIDQRRQAVWDPGQGGAAESRHRRERALEAAVLRALKRSPGSDLLRYLLNRSGEDEAFARRHAAFLRATLGNTDAGLGPELLRHVEKLTARATGDKVERLAQMLVQLRERLEGSSQERAAELLEDWKNRYPQLKLKLFHMQQGWS